MTGNNRVSDFASFPALASSIYTAYAFNNYPYPGYTLSALPNENLKWETTEQLNLGADIGFIDNKINLSIDAYKKITHDLLLYADLPYTTGFPNAYLNIGKTQNTGLEFTLNTENIKTNTFTWKSNFNISFNNNKVLGLAQNQETLLTSVYFDTGYNNIPAYISKIGKPMGMMYGFIYDGTYKYEDFDKDGENYILKINLPNNGFERSKIQPGDVKYKDINKDGVVNDKDKTIIGRGHPIYIGGLTNTFTFGDRRTWGVLDLSLFFQWSYGNNILNANKLIFETGVIRDANKFASYANRWTPDNPKSNIPRVGGQGPVVFSSRVIEDGSFIRLKNISLSYDFPFQISNKIKTSNLQLFLAIENLVTITKYSGFDPEVSIRNSPLTPSFDYSAYPRAITYSGGMKINF